MNSIDPTFKLNFKDQNILVISLAAFFIFGGLLMLISTNSEIFLFLNGFNNALLDHFFRVATYLGDGLFYAFIVIALIFIRFGYALDFAFSAGISAIFVQSGKRLFFADAKRPLAELGSELVHIVEGVDVHMARSFPSGHSTSAMLIFFFLALIIKNKSWKFAMLILAFIGGYSRIYLSQHFFKDVYAGFAIGVFSVLLIAFLRNRIGEPNWYRKKISF